jgi:hypothetical protein
MQNAQLGTQASITNANNANQAGIAAGRNATALRQSQAQLFGQGAGLAGQFAGQGAGFQMGAGRNVADILGGAGRSTAGYRFNAGQDIANRIGTTTGSMSDLQNQQGRDYSNVIGSGGVNLSNLYTGAGGIAGMGQAELARLLANVNMRQGTQAGNNAYNQGQINSQAYLNQGNNYVNTMGDLLKLYNSQKPTASQQAELDILTEQNNDSLSGINNQFGGG